MFILIIGSVAGLAMIWSRLSALEDRYVEAEEARTMQMIVQSIYADVAQTNLSARTLILDPKNTRAVGNLKKAAETVEGAFKRFNEVAQRSDQTQFKEGINGLYDLFKKDASEQKIIVELALGMKTAEATEWMKTKENPIWRQFRDDLLVLRTAIGKEAETRTEFAKLEASRQKVAVVVLSLFIVGLAVAVYLLSNRSLGKLSVEIDNIRMSADAAAQSSGVLDKTSEDLAAGSTQQAAALQQTAASLEEISRMVSSNSDHAGQLQNSAQESELSSRNSQQAVQEMSDAIQAISRSNEELIHEIQATGKEIEDIIKIITDIGSKTKVINDIVFQTKLLSFNASVEAARAGEAGKGFSVVAEEVGNLAQVSGSSAQDITLLLDQSTQRVRGIVENMQSKLDRLAKSGRGQVEEGVRSVDNCRALLEDVVTRVSASGQMVKDIAEASVEQARGVEEISRALRELDQASNKTVGASGQTSESAKKMSEQAVVLQELLSRVTQTVHGTGKRAA